MSWKWCQAHRGTLGSTNWLQLRCLRFNLYLGCKTCLQWTKNSGVEVEATLTILWITYIICVLEDISRLLLSCVQENKIQRDDREDRFYKGTENHTTMWMDSCWDSVGHQPSHISVQWLARNVSFLISPELVLLHIIGKLWSQLQSLISAKPFKVIKHFDIPYPPDYQSTIWGRHGGRVYTQLINWGWAFVWERKWSHSRHCTRILAYIVI